MSELFVRCSFQVFVKKYLRFLVSLCQVLRCLRASSDPAFLLRGFQDLGVRMFRY